MKLIDFENISENYNAESLARYDPGMLSPERHQQLAEWGFNAIRLGSMWSGVEPVEGQVVIIVIILTIDMTDWMMTLQYPTFQINETYVEVLKTIVEGLKQNGIYTYLDMHQV